MERKNVITTKGNPLTLVGPALKVGDKAPDFRVVDTSMKEVTLSDSKGKPRLFSVVPSLDTGLCSLQTRTFNQRLSELSADAAMYTISADLPFAQSRFVEENKISGITLVSDHRDMSFGENYGLKIKELRLLTRSVLVVDKHDVIKYIQIVPETTNEPDYDSALEALKKELG